MTRVEPSRVLRRKPAATEALDRQHRLADFGDVDQSFRITRIDPQEEIARCVSRLLPVKSSRDFRECDLLHVSAFDRSGHRAHERHRVRMIYVLASPRD